MKYLTLLTLASTSLFLTSCGDKGAPDTAASEQPADSPTPSAETTEAAPAAASGGTIALTTEIPAEMIEGTPQPIKMPNLEKAPTSVPTMSVPVGTVLLSAGKEVTGSDDFPIIGELAYLTDGDKQAGEGYFVELMDGIQWVQIDLGAPADLHAIWMWHYHSQKRAYKAVIVQLSNDPEFKTGVTTLFNNDYENTAGVAKGSDKPYVESRFGKLLDAKGTNAQYVRLYSAGNTANDMNHYTEVEVYGIAK